MTACGGTGSKASNNSNGSGSAASGNNSGSSSSGSGSGSSSSSSGSTSGSSGSGSSSSGSGSSGGTSSGGGSASSGTYAYVGDSSGGQIAGFAIAADGSATATPGSPYQLASLLSAPDQGNFLFGLGGGNLSAYAVAGDGSLKLAASTPSPGASISADRAGKNVYALLPAFDANSYAEYAVGGDGSAKQIGTTNQNMFYMSGLTFSQDNLHAYSHGCQMTGQVILGFNRNPDGTLTAMKGETTFSDSTGYWYCPTVMAASTTQNNMAVAYSGGSGDVIVVYSVAQDGTLNQVGQPYYLTNIGVNDLAWDNSGRYLVAATKGGLQVLQFTNSALVPVGAPQGGSSFDTLRFDTHEQLIALSNSNDSLYVFNFLAGVLTAGAGSPHPLPFSKYLSLAVVR